MAKLTSEVTIPELDKGDISRIIKAVKNNKPSTANTILLGKLLTMKKLMVG